MAFFNRRSWQDEMLDDVGQHLSALRHEVANLSGEAGKRGQKLAERYGNQLGHQLHDTAGQLQHAAGEIGGALVHQGTVAAREVGRQAQRATRAVQRDPLPTVAVVVALACVASLMLARRR
ncbi:MAG TPA: hypothetical protein PK286_02950 [Devosia sp.]|nr:hypothetical protein [Devosia sp.]